MDWDGIQVTIYTKHDVGGKTFLPAPNHRHPTFKLHYVPGSNPRAYKIEFARGYMQDCWSRCSPLVEEGADSPPPLTDLVHLVEDDPSINDKYGRSLLGLLGKMQKVNSTLKMLRGTMPVVFQGQQQTDLVRIVYLTGVVPVDDGGPPDDLVVVALAPARPGGPQENGGGSGPPR